jgi:predicted pyridoxine 5'-phosphate oxidase superfamily flavin-nucleotide-binding protein
MHGFSNIAFTPRVKFLQETMGSRGAYARREGQGESAADVLGVDEVGFLAERDSFYMASVGESGWPYIQHRGGPKGFLKVIDERTLAFADLRGNRQYVSLGNVSGDDRVALILVDYPNRARLKIFARASVVTKESDPETFARIAGDGRPERVYLLHVEGLDWNCPQHITPRFTEEEVREMARPLVAKIEELEREIAVLRSHAMR